ncbi:type IV pilus modification protein PilV [Microbulbifer sp. 2304DJ12-6]|uniref:type IV pilus modification protein PilV n=1 Tax=Microbulbifer sp. 2304DJ12-6 TaxID=3233340 RepID=UPI0039AFDF4A
MKLLTGQRGAGLIEVMVTVLILSTSLLGLAALQNRALQYNHSAYMRSQANVLAYDLFDRIRANRNQRAAYDLAVDAKAPTTSGNLVNRDLAQWRGLLAERLPAGTGGIECDAAGVCTVTIQWGEQDATGADGDGEVSRFQYMTRI